MTTVGRRQRAKDGQEKSRIDKAKQTIEVVQKLPVDRRFKELACMMLGVSKMT